MKVNGKMTRLMVPDATLIVKEQSTKESSLKICNMGMVKKHGKMEHFTKETTKLAKEMATVNWFFRINHNTRDIL